MSKNGRNRHKGNGTTGKRGPGSPVPGSVSLSTFRVGRALDALTPAFVQWFDDGSPGAASIALGALKPVESVLGRYMDGTAAAEVTGFEPIPFAIAVTDEVVATADASAFGKADVGNAGFVISAVYTYVDFLSDTGRWSGSAEELAGVMDFLDAVAQDDGEPGVVDVPDISDEEALEVFSGLPLIRRATALFQWIGDGKAVTATGALRLRDIEAAAACIGVTVKGSARRADDTTPGTTGSAEPVPAVRSMYEVPLLAQLWNTLADTELIDIGTTKAVPSAESGAFLGGAPSERLVESVFFVDQFLKAAVLVYDPEQPWERLIAGTQASILLAASTADPPERQRVLAAPDEAPVAEQSLVRAVTGAAVRRLEALAEQGLLTIDTHFRVPPALVRCIANVFDDDRVLADLGLIDASEDAGPGSAMPGPAVAASAPETAAAAAPQAETSILQLKIMLNDSKPPIWRRVLIPADMPLPLLHEVIQTLFGWSDTHLHEFRTGGFRGPSYVPADPGGEDDLDGEDAHDEAAATVGELLPTVGSTMTYAYDFGDNWVHGIKVEKNLAGDGGLRLPRCTAGRGAAPAEDSGGTQGWANIVRAVNDPGHEDHREYREWLGMLPGDTLDPKEFDIDEVNEHLAELF